MAPSDDGGARDGHTYLKHSDAPDELGFYAVVVDVIYTDACEGDGELMEVGPSVDDFAAAGPLIPVKGARHPGLNPQSLA